MKDDTLIGFSDPVGFTPDPLTEVLRRGARDLLAQAVEAEVSEFLREYTALTDDAGARRYSMSSILRFLCVPAIQFQTH